MDSKAIDGSYFCGSAKKKIIPYVVIEEDDEAKQKSKVSIQKVFQEQGETSKKEHNKRRKTNVSK